MESENSLSETAKPRPWMGWLKGIGWGALLLALFIMLGMFWHQGEMASKLQETLAELDRTEPGWRLEEIEAARDDPPEEQNSARIVVAAAEMMPQRWPSADFRDEHFRSLPPNEMLSGEDFVLLSREVTSARVALTTASRLADMPRGRHRIHYERNPIMTLLPHVDQSRRLVTLLTYESMRFNQKGDSKNALTSCRAALNVARSIGDEPVAVSQLARTACVVHVCQAVERTLGQGEPLPENMSALQKLLENEDAFPALLIATRGERALLHKVFECAERGEVSVDELEGTHHSGARSDWLKSTVIDLWRMNTQEDNALFLSLMTRRVKEVQQPMHEQGVLEKEFGEEARALVGQHPRPPLITRLILPAFEKMSGAFRRKHALLRCTIAALASEHYRREKKAWPDNIDQLCPQYLATVPLDPYDGKPLRYHRVEDGVVIYSVGQDGVDNGGHLGRERPTMPGMDIGFRLWDVPKRRQTPRPKPPDPNPK
jgi:hypothetical protein